MIGRSERSGLFGQVGRREIDDDTILRAREAAIDHRPFDPMRTFLDRLLGQPDQHGLG